MNDFESESVLNKFKELFKQAFPNGCDVRQMADLMAFFMAGYQDACLDYRKAQDDLGFEGGELFMDGLKDDNHNRVQYLIKCMVKGDYSHKMFKV